MDKDSDWIAAHTKELRGMIDAQLSQKVKAKSSAQHGADAFQEIVADLELHLEKIGDKLPEIKFLLQKSPSGDFVLKSSTSPVVRSLTFDESQFVIRVDPAVSHSVVHPGDRQIFTMRMMGDEVFFAMSATGGEETHMFTPAQVAEQIAKRFTKDSIAKLP